MLRTRILSPWPKIAGVVCGIDRVETVYWTVDGVGCRMRSVCVGGEVNLCRRVSIAIGVSLSQSCMGG